jgi:hypothetical protein
MAAYLALPPFFVSASTHFFRLSYFKTQQPIIEFNFDGADKQYPSIQWVSQDSLRLMGTKFGILTALGLKNLPH